MLLWSVIFFPVTSTTLRPSMRGIASITLFWCFSASATACSVARSRSTEALRDSEAAFSTDPRNRTICSVFFLRNMDEPVLSRLFLGARCKNSRYASSASFLSARSSEGLHFRYLFQVSRPAHGRPSERRDLRWPQRTPSDSFFFCSIRHRGKKRVEEGEQTTKTGLEEQKAREKDD